MHICQLAVERMFFAAIASLRPLPRRPSSCLLPPSRRVTVAQSHCPAACQPDPLLLAASSFSLSWILPFSLHGSSPVRLARSGERVSRVATSSSYLCIALRAVLVAGLLATSSSLEAFKLPAPALFLSPASISSSVPPARPHRRFTLLLLARTSLGCGLVVVDRIERSTSQPETRHASRDYLHCTAWLPPRLQRTKECVQSIACTAGQ